MSAHNTKNSTHTDSQDAPSGNVPHSDRTPAIPPKDRERLRDMIVVFVTYPLTPTKEANKLAEKKPWLEFISLLLKVVLALYALYQAAFT